jgi:phosphoglycerate dehydrogenase-like enzyme
VDILLLDAVAPEAVTWLEQRHSVALRPELAHDPAGLRKEGYKTRALVLPRQTVVTRQLLDFLPKLKAIARLDDGDNADNTDITTCKARRIKLVNAGSSGVRSGAEYLLSGLMMLYRPGLVSAFGGPSESRESRAEGRELHGSTVGLLGLSPTAMTLAGLLAGLGVRLIGYDPAVHHTSDVWQRLQIKPVTLPELISRADAVSVQMLGAARARGFVNERLLARCRCGQRWVSISRTDIFDEAALAAALQGGRIEAFLLDAPDGKPMSAASPLANCKNLVVTQRLAAHTRESRLRASWYVAHRLHDAISDVGSLRQQPAAVERAASELNEPLSLQGRQAESLAP